MALGDYVEDMIFEHITDHSLVPVEYLSDILFALDNLVVKYAIEEDVFPVQELLLRE